MFKSIIINIEPTELGLSWFAMPGWFMRFSQRNSGYIFPQKKFASDGGARPSIRHPIFIYNNCVFIWRVKILDDPPVNPTFYCTGQPFDFLVFGINPPRNREKLFRDIGQWMEWYPKLDHALFWYRLECWRKAIISRCSKDSINKKN